MDYAELYVESWSFASVTSASYFAKCYGRASIARAPPVIPMPVRIRQLRADGPTITHSHVRIPSSRDPQSSQRHMIHDACARLRITAVLQPNYAPSRPQVKNLIYDPYKREHLDTNGV